MSRYDAKTILEKVEAFAFNSRYPGAVSEEISVNGNVRDYALPGTLQTFEASILPQLGMHNAVNKTTEGSRFPLFKKIYLKLFSPFLNRQAVFNAETLRAFDVLANHTDKMQHRILEHQDALKGIWHDLEKERQEKNEFQSIAQELLERDEEKTEVMENLMEELSELHQQIIRLAQDTSISENNLKLQYQQLENRIAEQKQQFELIIFKTAKQQRMNELKYRQLELKNSRINTSQQNQITANYDQTFRSINDLRHHVEYLVQKSDQSWVVESFKGMETRIGKSEADMRDLETRLEDAQRYRSAIEDALKEIERSRDNDSVPSRNDFSTMLRNAEKDLEYWRFQKQFRADDETLRKRHEKYLNILAEKFEDTSHVTTLDLACGDGVFLSLQKEAGWKATGVDLNSIMVDRGNELDLEIVHGDALEYLGTQSKASYDLISAMQFVEHLTPDQISKLIEDAHYALKSGGILLIETINPHTLMAHKWFHFDLTHQNMIYPENLKLMTEAKGFHQVRFEGINPVENYARLNESEPHTENWKKLNELLYGNQDYYLIAMKP